MSSPVGLGDAVALVSIAYGLYVKVFLVAKHAPEDFRELLYELRAVKYLLFKIGSTLDATNRNDLTAYFLVKSMETLDKFRPLEARYDKLASSDRKLWPTKLRYAKDQNLIKECRAELQDIWQKMLAAMSADAMVARHSNSGLRPPAPWVTVLEDHQNGGPINHRASDKANTVKQSEPTIHKVDSGYSSDRLPSPFENNGQSMQSDFKDTQIKTSSSFHRPSISTVTAKPTRLVAGERPLSVHGRDYLRSGSLVTAFTQSQPSNSEIEPPVVVNPEILQPYRQFAISEHQEIDLWCREEISRFESKGDPTLSVDHWLVLAVWWFLKSRAVRHAFACSGFGKRNDAMQIDHASQDDWNVKISIKQANLDLMKSEVILRRILLDKLSQCPITQAQWKVVQDLSTAIHDDVHRHPEINFTAVDWRDVPTNDTRFTEPFVQCVEYSEELPCALDKIEGPHRWLAVDVSHCGTRNEKLLFRTFVNAQIGEIETCRKSTRAPYVLLLWSRLGSCELYLSLLNQHGTVHLARNIVRDDVEFHDDNVNGDTQFTFDFPSQNAVIKFLSAEDLQSFLTIPRQLFGATETRRPRDSEILVYRQALEGYGQRNQMAPGSYDSAARTTCEVSLFQMVPQELWRCTRRIVISSSPGINQRQWAIEYFLPLTMVQVRRLGMDVTLIWSDFRTLEEERDGDYTMKWSFVYHPENAQSQLQLTFQTEHAAEAFAEAILRPFETPFEAPEFVRHEKPDFQTPSISQELQIYRLRDTNEMENAGYYAICQTKKDSQTKSYTEAFFVHRDIDFNFRGDVKNSVNFVGLHVPHYISDKTGMLSKPNDEEWKNASFAEASRRVRDVCFSFESVEEISRLMRNLLGWDLKHVQTVPSVRINANTRLFYKVHREIVASLWEKSLEHGKKELRLALRSEYLTDLRWTTATIDASVEVQPKSNKVFMKGVLIQQGPQIDGRMIAATNTSTPDEPPHDCRATLTFTFEGSEQAKNFVRRLYRLLDTGPIGNGLDLWSLLRNQVAPSTQP